MKSLRVLAVGVLLVLLPMIVWASLRQPLWAIPAEVGGNPWFLTTLADIYSGFLIFFAWVAYRETTWRARAAWLLALLTLGNVASAGYLLLALRRLPADAGVDQLLLRPACS